MQILITAPSESELFPSLPEFPEIDLCCTGVGSASSVYHLTKAIQQKSYNLVIQMGVCGSFNLEKYPMGQVVFVQKDRFGDLGAWQQNHFFDISELGFQPKDNFPYQEGWLVNPYSNKFEIPAVHSITINSIQDDGERNRHLLEKYGADIETMEGASLHYVCLKENISFVQLRAVSNEVGQRDKKHWRLNEAIENLHYFTKQFLAQIKTG